MIRSLRNSIDFLIRNQLPWGRSVSEKNVHPETEQWQSELDEFLRLFKWNTALRGVGANRTLRVADVGAKTLVAGPVISRLFSEVLGDLEKSTEVHGIEIDAFRRFTSFRTRNDYGKYFASQIPNGHFHAMDFLDWTKPLDAIFLLHPFVTLEPLLHWGLPKSKFKPNDLFKHAAKCLKHSETATLLLSCPSEEELKLAHKLATENGFFALDWAQWLPTESSTQQQPRLGVLYSLV